ncbi:MAG: vitamin K epoxide reductase family protein [Candidatus Pacearchaeota archaeon]|jgi:uncharacterized membrane protein|nr:vitamin K epoxide reductase family protein [Candidatus Pacearchaeota archaeon]
MKRETKYKIIIGLMILATATSIVLSFMSIEQACGLVGGTSCSTVQNSSYETIFFGIKNAHIGLVAFPLLALLAFFELKRPKKYQKIAITAGVMIGSVLALYFLYLQFFVIKAICEYCMIVDFAVLISMALIIFWDEK